MPVFSVKIGRRCPNKPESFIEVVETTTIVFSCVRPGPAKKMALQKAARNASVSFRANMTSPSALHMLAFGGKADTQRASPLTLISFDNRQTWTKVQHRGRATSANRQRP